LLKKKRLVVKKIILHYVAGDFEKHLQFNISILLWSIKDICLIRKQSTLRILNNESVLLIVYTKKIIYI